MSDARFAHSRRPSRRFFDLRGPEGYAVVAESVLTKHQMLILNRSRRRAPNLRIQDRLIAGLCSLWRCFRYLLLLILPYPFDFMSLSAIFVYISPAILKKCA